jgi:hypothetical protein
VYWKFSSQSHEKCLHNNELPKFPQKRKSNTWCSLIRKCAYQLPVGKTFQWSPMDFLIWSWLQEGDKTWIKNTNCKEIFLKEAKVLGSNLFLHITRKPRELKILTKCRILQGPSRQVRFVWQYLQNSRSKFIYTFFYIWMQIACLWFLNSWTQLLFERCSLKII